MIRYAKSLPAPSSLRRGVAATTADCDAYVAHPAEYDSGVRDFDITSGIYGTQVVKRQLKRDQHDKCAFCEAIFDANVAGDVEHYRPKGAVMTDAGRIYPGYYWLGYVWANLSYACPDCNQYRKKDHFPLVDEAARALNHHENIDDEEPLLLDPYGARDPRDHILFKGEAPVGQTPEGNETIDILDLGRTTLARDRLAHLRNLTRFRESAALLSGDPRPAAVTLVADLQAQLAAAVAPEARFSAAAADHLAALARGENFLPD